MTTNISAIRTYLGKNEEQFLRAQIEERTGNKIKLEQAEKDANNWGDTDPELYPVLAFPLSELPFTMPDGWVKAGIVKRFDPGFSILFNNMEEGDSMIRRIQQPLKIIFERTIVQEQCLHQFPHWIPFMSDSEADAIFTSTFNKKQTDLRPSFDFDPIELIPPPSSGIICLVTRENDKNSRRWCKQLMDRETAMCSNLEREILQLKQNSGHKAELFAFSRKTDSGFETAATLNTGEKWIRTLENFSSTAGAAKMIWESLEQKLDN